MPIDAEQVYEDLAACPRCGTAVVVPMIELHRKDHKERDALARRLETLETAAGPGPVDSVLLTPWPDESDAHEPIFS